MSCGIEQILITHLVSIQQGDGVLTYCAFASHPCGMFDILHMLLTNSRRGNTLPLPFLSHLTFLQISTLQSLCVRFPGSTQKISIGEITSASFSTSEL
jgi:hypothetical protein